VPSHSPAPLHAVSSSRRTGALARPAARRLRPTLLAAAMLFAALGATPANAEAEGSGRVIGVVRSQATGRPVAGAVVTLRDGPATTTSADGRFAFPDPVPVDGPVRRLEVRAQAPGYGTWTIVGAPLRPGDTVTVEAALRTGPWTHRVLLPEERVPATLAPRAVSTPADGARPDLTTCTGWGSSLVPPPAIKVLITDTGQVQTLDLVWYLRHVLPNEWGTTWDADALGAGAIAVKTFSWWRSLPGNAYWTGPPCADISDAYPNQVYDPTWSSAATDQAVYATLGSVLRRDGVIFVSTYFAGTPGMPCAPIEEGQFEGWMAQWGTKSCADQGMLWPDVSRVFYQNTTWTYLQNLLLNPNLEADPLYPFHSVGKTKVERISGNAYQGGFYLAQKPKRAGQDSTVYQQHDFLGTPTSPYHASVALRCGQENHVDCQVSVRITVFEQGGGAHERKKSVILPNDGEWHEYGFNPDPFGVSSVSVRLTTVTKQSIGVDALVLSSPFGG
jgi:hypothetical protein